MKTLQLFAVFLTFILLISGISVTGLSQKKENKSLNTLDEEVCSDNFYFVHLTDPHILHKLFDKKDAVKNKFNSVLNRIRSFEKKPEFVVVTGDLVEWGGFGITGALNYKAFLECFYKQDEQLYLNPEYNIPIYTIPGNHDYRWGTKINNYHRFIDKKHDNDRYIVSYENLSLFFLDSGHDYMLNPGGWIRMDGLHVMGSGLYNEDIEWLNESLNEYESYHKIVLMHHPAVDRQDNFGKMIDVIARNREEFIGLCKEHDVGLVLTGHTHKNAVYDANGDLYHVDNLGLNCSHFSTFFVQTGSCRDGTYYRNITISSNDIWLNQHEQSPVSSNDVDGDAVNLHYCMMINGIMSRYRAPNKYIFLDIQNNV